VEISADPGEPVSWKSFLLGPPDVGLVMFLLVFGLLTTFFL